MARLPEGRRKASFAANIHRAIDGIAEVPPHDEAAARIHADIQEARRGIGRPFSIEDGMTAAICLARGAALATRNVNDFDGLGLELVNPWR